MSSEPDGSPPHGLAHAPTSAPPSAPPVATNAAAPAKALAGATEARDSQMTMPVTEDVLAPGTRLGKYRVEAPIGRGGMGAVYRGVHTTIGKAVALKVLAREIASDPEAQARFLREAASACVRRHPHIVDVTDFGNEDGRPYLVMELLDGHDLASVIERGPMAVDAIADVMLPVCAAVTAAHEAGVIHRDIKPPNIFLARTATREVVPKVLDFGISKPADGLKNTRTLTQAGHILGTPQYMAPELLAGRAAGPVSDEYALGVVLYECATGRRPFDEDNLFALMRAIDAGDCARPKALRPSLPDAFEQIIVQAMSRDPAARFPSVHALGSALLPFASPKRKLMWAEYFEGGQILPLETTSAPAASPATPGAGTSVLATPHATRTILPTPAPGPGTGAQRVPGRDSLRTPLPTSHEIDEPARAPRKALWLGVAAGVALAVGLGGWLVSRPSSPSTSASAPAAAAPPSRPAPAMPAPTIAAPAPPPRPDPEPAPAAAEPAAPPVPEVATKPARPKPTRATARPSAEPADPEADDETEAEARRSRVKYIKAPNGSKIPLLH